MIFDKLAVHRLVGKAVLFSAFAFFFFKQKTAYEIVIAIRYLQAEGTSQAHLYLYREDGKLLRQLTNDNSGQDSGPIFAPDGSVIVFAREKPKAERILERRAAWATLEETRGSTRLVHAGQEL